MAALVAIRLRVTAGEWPDRGGLASLEGGWQALEVHRPMQSALDGSTFANAAGVG